MKLLTTTAIYIAFITVVYAQDARSFYEQGMNKAEAGKLEDAIKLFDKSIALESGEFVVWYNRGIAKNMLGLFEEALPDFEQTIKLKPEYKKGYLNLGTTKKHLTDYQGALDGYTKALGIDDEYAEAYYNRGLVYELLGNKEMACDDFNTAKEFGLKQAHRKVDKCNDTSTAVTEVHSILRLTKTAGDDKYGYTEKQPVKVGSGPDGGPDNQIRYLELLRDVKGKPVKYERKGSCCAYESPQGFMGVAMLDRYEITYLNESGKEKKVTIYISFYDYEEPMIISGFKTIGQKN